MQTTDSLYVKNSKVNIKCTWDIFMTITKKYSNNRVINVNLIDWKIDIMRNFYSVFGSHSC